MGILSSLTFPRAMIFGTLVGSLITGWFVYQRTAELHALEADVRQAPLVVRSIQMKAQELDQLESAANREGLKGDILNDIETYIRQKASGPNINLGQVDFTPSTSEPFRGVEDLKYKIKPREKTQRALRGSIANFLYTLEQDSRRIKVTSIKIQPFEKGLKPGQLGNDYWTFEAEITSRRAKEGGA